MSPGPPYPDPSVRQWDYVSSRPDDSGGWNWKRADVFAIGSPAGCRGVRTRWLCVSICRPCKGRTIIAHGFIHGFRTPASTPFARGCSLLRGVVDRAQQEAASGRAEGAVDRHPWMNPWAMIVTPFRARACGWTRPFAPRRTRGFPSAARLCCGVQLRRTGASSDR